MPIVMWIGIPVILLIATFAALVRTRAELKRQRSANRFLVATSARDTDAQGNDSIQSVQSVSDSERAHNGSIIPKSFSFRLNDNESSEIVFNNVSQRKLRRMGKSLKPINHSNPLQSLPAIGINAAAVATSPALFTATVAPAALTKFADGTFSTMIHGAKGILRNAGFSQLSPTSVFAPILIFQAASILTGQYYMNGINKQLQTIDKRINHLIDLHHLERASTLRGHHRILSEIAQKEHLAAEDLNELRTVVREANTIREHYLALLGDLDCSSYHNIRQRFTAKRTLDDILQKVCEERFGEYGQLIRASERTILVAKSLEFKCNLHLAKTDPERVKFALEKADDIRCLAKQIVDDEWDKPIERMYSGAVRSARMAKAEAVLDSSKAKAIELDKSLNEMWRSCIEERKNLHYDASLASESLAECLEKPRNIVMYFTDQGEVKYAELAK